MRHKSSSSIPEPIVQLQHELEAIPRQPCASDQAAGVALAFGGGIGAAARPVFGCPSAAAGLCAVEETCGRSCAHWKRSYESTKEGSGVGIGVRDRVRVCAWWQNAHSVDGRGRPGLDKPSPRVAGSTRFLILPWVRVEHLASHILGRMVAGEFPEMPVKQGFGIGKSGKVFGHGQKNAGMVRAGLHAHVSTEDQKIFGDRSIQKIR